MKILSVCRIVVFYDFVKSGNGNIMTKPSFEWNDNNVNLLKELWNSGISARDIAQKLGEGVTRNAVIGKANRLGISASKTNKVKFPKKNYVTIFPDDNQCQWPFGHPNENNFYFCAEEVQKNRPYCEEHCGQAYRKLSVSGNRN